MRKFRFEDIGYKFKTAVEYYKQRRHYYKPYTIFRKQNVFSALYHACIMFYIAEDQHYEG